MQNPDEQNNEISHASDELPPTNPFKAAIMVLGGLGLLFSIFALLPMLFTLMSDGDFRAPAEIHPTDTAAKKLSQNSYQSNGYNK
jgi:hypothetical protein